MNYDWTSCGSCSCWIFVLQIFHFGASVSESRRCSFPAWVERKVLRCGDTGGPSVVIFFPFYLSDLDTKVERRSLLTVCRSSSPCITKDDSNHRGKWTRLAHSWTSNKLLRRVFFFFGCCCPWHLIRKWNSSSFSDWWRTKTPLEFKF